MIDLLLPSLCRQPDLHCKVGWFRLTASKDNLHSTGDCMVWQLGCNACLRPISLDQETGHHPIHHPASHIMVLISNCVAVCTVGTGGACDSMLCRALDATAKCRRCRLLTRWLSAGSALQPLAGQPQVINASCLREGELKD